MFFVTVEFSRTSLKKELNASKLKYSQLEAELRTVKAEVTELQAALDRRRERSTQAGLDRLREAQLQAEQLLDITNERHSLSPSPGRTSRSTPFKQNGSRSDAGSSEGEFSALQARLTSQLSRLAGVTNPKGASATKVRFLLL